VDQLFLGHGESTNRGSDTKFVESTSSVDDRAS
jgi:hypothetical protein